MFLIREGNEYDEYYINSFDGVNSKEEESKKDYDDDDDDDDDDNNKKKKNRITGIRFGAIKKNYSLNSDGLKEHIATLFLGDDFGEMLVEHDDDDEDDDDDDINEMMIRMAMMTKRTKMVRIMMMPPV